MRSVRILLGVIVIAYLGVCGALFLFQRSLIYFPQPNSGNNNATTIILPNATARVRVSTRPKDSSSALIYFGGNAEDVSLNMPSLAVGFPDSAIYLLHYRGYGGSAGRPSEEALFADALVLFDQAHDHHPNVEVIGRSLGSGIAIYLASQRPVRRLVLVTPFDSLEEIAAIQYPYIPVRWLLIDKFESWKFAPHVTAPTLIIAAEHDEIVPRTNTELLRSRFRNEIVSFKILAGTSHNNIAQKREYIQLLKGFP